MQNAASEVTFTLVLSGDEVPSSAVHRRQVAARYVHRRFCTFQRGPISSVVQPHRGSFTCHSSPEAQADGFWVAAKAAAIRKQSRLQVAQTNLTVSKPLTWVIGQ